MSAKSRSRAESSRSKGSLDSKDASLRAKSNLLEQEEEYKRLNAELEAKTAALVREAEAIMTEQDHFLMESSPHKSPSLDDLSSHDTDEDLPTPMKQTGFDQYSRSAVSGLLDLVDNDEYEASDDAKAHSARVSSRSTRSGASSGRRPVSAKAPKRPSTGSSKTSKKPARKPTVSAGSSRSRAADDVAIPSDFMSKLTLDGAISNIEKNLDGVSARDLEDDDILPGAAAEMGSEAQIRFLKAKLRVMQEEVDRLSQECHSGNEERKKLNSSLKNATEEQTRLQKNNNAQQVQIEKHKKLLAEEKRKSESVGMQVQNLRKELDGHKREQKQTSVTHNATEVRLNRALEDVERYKSQLHKDKNSNKESAENDRREMERLRLDNKRLERLKNEMNTVFKKQQKLISILKRQILHIEAAKLLSFTEEEFVRALDWGSK